LLVGCFYECNTDIPRYSLEKSNTRLLKLSFHMIAGILFHYLRLSYGQRINKTADITVSQITRIYCICAFVCLHLGQQISIAKIYLTYELKHKNGLFVRMDKTNKTSLIFLKLLQLFKKIEALFPCNYFAYLPNSGKF